MGTKLQSGKHDCYEAAKDNEPMFVLLARDPLAPTVVRIWAELRALTREGESLTASCDEKVHEALACSQAMRYWKRENKNV